MSDLHPSSSPPSLWCQALANTADYQSLFDALSSTIPSSILIVDESLAVVMANRNFLEKSRGTLSAVQGLNLQKVLPSAFRDTPLDQQIREVIRTGKSLQRQRMTYRAPGIALRVYSYSIRQLQLGGQAARAALLVMDDITDLLILSEEVRRTQLHLASIVESAGDLIISTDAGGRILTWNAAANEVTGYSPRETLGCLLADLIAAPQQTEVKLCFSEIHRSDRRLTAEWPMTCADGKVIPISWHLSPMTGSDGSISGVVIVGRNLVEQREMEAQMHQAEKLAALGLVIGGIAHEIRNPLGVSFAAAQLLRRGIGTPELLLECIQKVIGGINRASLIVDSLLRFARPGRIQETTRVDVVEVLRNALMLVAGEASPGTTVQWDTLDLPAAVYAEGVQSLLELVMINLITNAFQAMADGGVLTIKVRSDQDILITMHNTGPGISEAQLSKVFDPFFSLRNDSRRSGLGLFVSHSIVQQHGGTIAVRSSLSEGTSFSVRLPRAKSESPPPRPAAPA
jgi:PAS domain S-box-containing protein